MNVGALFFLSITGWAFLWMLLFPRLKAGHALLSALCGMLFAAYFGVIAAGAMAATAYGLIYGGLGGLAAGLAAAAFDLRGLRSRLCSVGLLGFLLLSLAAALLTRGCVVQDHDSLSYWARIVKELFVYQRFPINGDSTMFHSDYFPLMASLQYCLMRVFGWQDAYLLYVTCACVLVSVAAVADLLESRPAAALAVLLLPYAFTAFGSPLFSTRADGPISALFAAGALCLYMRRGDSPDHWLPAFWVAVVLTGFKIYTGLMLSLLLCGCMLLSLRGAARQNRAALRPLAGLCLLALAMTLALQFSWSGLYHYHTRLAAYEASVAAAPYTGIAVQGEAPAFLLRDLFTGNPRTGSLLHTLNAESFQQAGKLIGLTFSDYAASKLPWLWLFLLPAALIAALADPKGRGRVCKLLAAMLLAAVLYLLGLFASYFVQAETYGAAVGYLVTVTTPLCWAALFLLLRAAEGRFGGRAGALTQREAGDADGGAAGTKAVALWARIALPLALVGMLFLSPPASFAQNFTFDHALTSYSALADAYYAEEIVDQLIPEDQHKRALLIDCSYAASEIKSESGKTHAYQYYGMPMRVTVLQYPYANYDLLDSISPEGLLGVLNGDRCDLLLLRVEDEVYWDSLRDALSLDGDWDEPTAVYDVLREDGEIRFHCRLDEDEPVEADEGAE